MRMYIFYYETTERYIFLWAQDEEWAYHYFSQLHPHYVKNYVLLHSFPDVTSADLIVNKQIRRSLNNNSYQNL